MWFDDNRSAGKRLFIDVRKMSRNSGARSNVRLGAKGDKADRTTMVVLFLGLGVVCLGLLWFAVKKTGESFYSKNDRFAIAHLDINIKGGKLLTPDLIREYTRIQEGLNLFAFDARDVRDTVLRKTPTIKSLVITRRLPDTVRIDVVEREPVARFGSKSGVFVADRDGYVFILPSGRGDLPVIMGKPEGDIKPGMTLQGVDRSALEVLEAADDPRLALRVDAIDVSPDGYLLLYVPYDDSVKEIRLAWKGMNTGTPEAKGKLLEKLSWTAQALQSGRGKKIVKLDATLEGSRVDATVGAP